MSVPNFACEVCGDAADWLRLCGRCKRDKAHAATVAALEERVAELEVALQACLEDTEQEIVRQHAAAALAPTEEGGRDA